VHTKPKVHRKCASQNVRQSHNSKHEALKLVCKLTRNATIQPSQQHILYMALCTN